MEFLEKLSNAMYKNESLVCMGLDLVALPDSEPVEFFGRRVIDQTADKVCAYKLNYAFYEAEGSQSVMWLEYLVYYLRRNYPDLPIILDWKRGDIESTSAISAQNAFLKLKVDAVTLNAWAGLSSIEPYLDYPEKFVFLWCASTNKDAGALQDVPVTYNHETMPLYEYTALKAMEWNKRLPQIGVIGPANKLPVLRAIRNRCPDASMLIPGVGAQGGDMAACIAEVATWKPEGTIFPISRGILNAWDGEDTNLATAAEQYREISWRAFCHK